MTEKGFTTTGTAEYFAEREGKINARLTEAKSKIDEIEMRVRKEIDEITVRRDRIHHHLQGFVNARNDLVTHRAATVQLVAELNGVLNICDSELPGIDAMLDQLETGYEREDASLDEAEKSRRRQLKKHERAKTRYELRSVRLALRKNIALKDESETNGSAA